MDAPTFARIGQYVHATFDGDLYFSADDGVHGFELWRTDGTTAGTSMVTDDLSARDFVTRLYVASDRLFVLTAGGGAYAYDGTGRPVHLTGFGTLPAGDEGVVAGVVDDRLVLTGTGHHLYAVDPGTTVARPLDPALTAFEFSGADLAVLDGWGYFSGRVLRDRVDSPTEGVELLRTNGVVTELVADIDPGPEGSNPTDWVTTDRAVFFLAGDGSHGRELWTTDGTSDGTHLVRDHRAGESSELASLPVTHGHDVYYVPTYPANQLWRTDGTPEGTHLVADVSAVDSARVQPLASVGPELYYVIGYEDASARPGVERGLLVRTDGTPDGTRTVARLPGPIVEIGAPAVVGDRLYFSAPSSYGSALWRSDGTASGTFPVSLGGFDGAAMAGDPEIRETWTLGDRVVFSSRFRPAPGAEPTGQRRLHVLDPGVPDPVRRAVTAPALSWDATTGELSVSAGTWSSGTDTFTYQWYRNGSPIRGATAATLSTWDVLRLGDRVGAVVTGAGVGSASASASSPVRRVTRAALRPLPHLEPPVLRGRPVVGRQVVALLEGTFPDTLITYRWLVGNTVVPRAHGPRLRIRRGFVGKRVWVEVTMVRTGDDLRRRRSLPTSPVRARS